MDGEEKDVVPDAQKKNHIRSFESYYGTLTAIGLSGSKRTLEKIIEVLRTDACTFGQLMELSQEFTGRIVDETRDKQFFALSLREIELHSQPRRGWEKIVERFPTTIDDVEEASKCLALSRYPAAIFHSLQIVEAALIELGKFLKVKDPKSGWTAVSGALAKTLKKEWKDKSRFERKNHAFLEQVQGTVEGLKNAWRNKISHVDGKLVLVSKEFSAEVAEEILLASRAFTRRLAEGLPSTSARKKKL